MDIVHSRLGLPVLGKGSVWVVGYISKKPTRLNNTGLRCVCQSRGHEYSFTVVDMHTWGPIMANLTFRVLGAPSDGRILGANGIFGMIVYISSLPPSEYIDPGVRFQTVTDDSLQGFSTLVRIVFFKECFCSLIYLDRSSAPLFDD